jgi:hypothetical protein
MRVRGYSLMLNTITAGLPMAKDHGVAEPRCAGGTPNKRLYIWRCAASSPRWPSRESIRLMNHLGAKVNRSLP